MTRKENFNVLFYKKARLLKSGEAAIYMRISCNGTRVDCPTNYARVLDSSILEDMQQIREAMAGGSIPK